MSNETENEEENELAGVTDEELSLEIVKLKGEVDSALKNTEISASRKEFLMVRGEELLEEAEKRRLKGKSTGKN